MGLPGSMIQGTYSQPFQFQVSDGYKVHHSPRTYVGGVTVTNNSPFFCLVGWGRPNPPVGITDADRVIPPYTLATLRGGGVRDMSYAFIGSSGNGTLPSPTSQAGLSKGLCTITYSVAALSDNMSPLPSTTSVKGRVFQFAARWNPLVVGDNTFLPTVTNVAYLEYMLISFPAAPASDTLVSLQVQNDPGAIVSFWIQSRRVTLSSDWLAVPLQIGPLTREQAIQFGPNQKLNLNNDTAALFGVSVFALYETASGVSL